MNNFESRVLVLGKFKLINHKNAIYFQMAIFYLLRIPQSTNVRSMNLSNTAAIVIFEALRQRDFPNMIK